MKAKNAGWYLEVPAAFQSQNWWNEPPWLDDETGKRTPVPPDAVTYELARRHLMVGEMLTGRRQPRPGPELFLLEHARTAWPWLTAQAREDWGGMIQRTKGRKDRLQTISAFEASERVRQFQFNQPAKAEFHLWVADKRRALPEPRKVNEEERRKFKRICDRAFCQLNTR